MSKYDKQYYKYFVLGGYVSEEDFRKMQELKHTMPMGEFIKMVNEMRDRHQKNKE